MSHKPIIHQAHISTLARVASGRPREYSTFTVTLGAKATLQSVPFHEKLSSFMCVCNGKKGNFARRSRYRGIFSHETTHCHLSPEHSRPGMHMWMPEGAHVGLEHSLGNKLRNPGALVHTQAMFCA